MIDGIICSIKGTNDMTDLALASEIAGKLNVPMWYLRDKKGYGMNQEIEGDLKILKRCKTVVMVTRYKGEI